MQTRVTTEGKHLVAGDHPFRVRGVTYGSFAPRLDGSPFPERWRIKHDLSAMAAAGLNTLRTYAPPPDDLVEIAEELGLRIIVGLHYPDWRCEADAGRQAGRRVLEAGRRAVSRAMERFAERPSILAISVGNEVPADLVRLHGSGAVQDTLSELIQWVHACDAGMLACYTNFPTTEYLGVEGQDLVCFNVFLEEPESFRSYLRHLQIVSSQLPLVITELGLAAEVHGEQRQAEVLDWQLRTVDECGCAGATVFSWTDEWAIAGQPVEGWRFGITDDERHAKPAMEVVRRWAGSTLRDLRTGWPRISVVVCAYNGDQLIEKCLASLLNCDYPDLEVIVCDDGSTDRTLEIARRFPYKVLELPRSGLAEARNAGIRAATGELVAFIDADAFCHSEWPYHLALSLDDDDVVATGGPNLPVDEVGFVERAVALSPGAPMEVLVSDDRAEHVPGCNMAFRRQALEEIGGFDPIYTRAGDDADVCWKLLDQGRKIAFAAAAQVRHHRRGTVRGYLRQQVGYGRAERLLSRRHVHRFNRIGQARWSGVIYGGLGIASSVFRPVVYHGRFGQAPFQPVVRRRSEEVLAYVSALIPFLFAAVLVATVAAFLSAWALGAALVGLAVLLVYAFSVALAVQPGPAEPHRVGLRLTVAFLHLAQPLVRTHARLVGRRPAPSPRGFPTWESERARWLERLQRELEAVHCRVRPGSDYSSGDLDVSIGPLARCRITTAVLWGWTPVHSIKFRPRPAAAVAIVAGLALAIADPLLGAGALVAVGFGTLIDGALLWLVVRRSVVSTTRETPA